MTLETHGKLLKERVKPVDIQFKDLSYQVQVQKVKKTILKGISGTFSSGQLTAIMGPSGAGKSSLMNILTGLTTKGVNGNIQFGDSPTKSRKLCCYIMQDDHFHSWFTVEETMLLAAQLKISNDSMNMKEKKMLIEHLLDTLKLSQTKSTRAGNLSGGQKKRLSIALELIDNPAVLFLDEPTTGLDSSASSDTIQLLQTLANEGRTIVCTIHQPSSHVYSLFNQIYVLSQGCCTYQGTPHNTIDFLRTVGLECPTYHNPADFLLECVNGDYGDHTDDLAAAARQPKWRCDYDAEQPQHLDGLNGVQIVKIMESKRGGVKQLSPSITPPISATKHVYPPPEWMRLWLLIGRCHVQFFRDWTVTYLKLVVHIICAILIGLLYGDSGSNATKQIANLGSFTIHNTYLWYTTMMPGLLRFPQEICIVKKETFNNWYKLRTYYMATLITSTPVHIIFSMTYITIAYLMTDQPFEIERYAKFMLTAVVVTICADGLGVLLGTILNPINGTFVGAVLTCFMLIFSGFLILLTHMSSLMRLLSYLSPIRYALESMVLAIYSNNRGNIYCPMDVVYCHFKNASTVLRSFGMENGNFGMNILIMFLQLSTFKGLAYVMLKRKLRA
ncbi:PREDICTED: ATP-binding cassette sub-family G member 1 isoform X1 [Bactrocera latifrons]|uniref:ATP-binding cassette sub-family G member 1 n=2 Tax=Bactrocera latifrons TaxID=174628 RepID=A0A0K8W3Z9_BACLA|nr:PREDICTED: ATP-binding cassette sub-family G member 1 isoform X1 [Bactrocera latifrons]XP_018804493.1 PREDICTED: ATP-binding cassette sub-family G member 1 isoform X1 [Bactrocera latifrons]XP_018804495.1 PREDICTED: ATP-binding cassette sub-family G member 1 isoform X1 [Bactrocera latifrons]XP_018804496.1 PREDICTED: ATP-binding cassette sub-family G member 1 isoform X1 [Bactrocera latifrons]XP_018804497.1 PREDICTED: ATP-binding cassette sub-family G member 1 isoform X1 [Bactrocera latifrons]